MRRLVFLLLLIVSCTPRVLKTKISDADKSCSVDPDYAWEVVSSVDEHRLKSLRMIAWYRLVFAKAADKSYHDLTDESFLLPSWEYYRLLGSSFQKMEVQYYLGRICSNAGKTASAIVAFHAAEKFALKVGDGHYLGLIYRNLGGLYANSYDNGRASEYFRRSVEAFGDEKRYADYSVLALARSYMNQGQYGKGKNALDSLLRSAGSDPLLISEIHKTYIRYYSLNAPVSPEKALYHSSLISHDGLSPFYAGCIAYAHALTGQRDSAEYYLNHAWNHARNRVDSVDVLFDSYRIENLYGHFDKAFSYYERAVEGQDKIIRSQWESSFSSQLSDYYRAVSEKESLQRRSSIAILLSCLLALAIGLGVLFYLFRQRNKQIREDIQRFSELEGELSLLESRLSESGSATASLYSGRLRMLEKLAESYLVMEADYGVPDEKKGVRMTYQEELQEKERIIRMFRDSLRQFRGDLTLLQGLEDGLNYQHQGIMSRFRETYGSSFSEKDYHLLVLSFSHVPDHVIAFFMKMTPTNVRTRRSRCKQMIARSGAAERDIYLKMFNKR